MKLKSLVLSVILSVFVLINYSFAEKPDVKINDIIDSINKIGSQFEIDYNKLSEKLDQAVKSEEMATKKFDEMETHLKNISQKLSEESNIWIQATTLKKYMEKKKKNALSEIENAPNEKEQKKWKNFEQAWRKKVNICQGMIKDIGDERAKLEGNRKKIAHMKKEVLELIALEYADDALNKMGQILVNLKEVNSGLDKIVQNAESKIKAPL